MMGELSNHSYLDLHTHFAASARGKQCEKSDVVRIFSLRLGESEYPPQGGLYSVGIYPFDAELAADQDMESLEQIVRDDRVVAIGETGLDYRPEYKASAVSQLESFKRQVSLAARVGKPLIIHQVRALDDTLRVLETSARTPAIFHGFSGSVESALRIVRAGHYLSFGHLLCEIPKLQNVLRIIPSDRIFFETDGRESKIEEVYFVAARIKGMEIEELKDRIIENYRYVVELARENRIVIG